MREREQERESERVRLRAEQRQSVASGQFISPGSFVACGRVVVPENARVNLIQN